MKSFGQRVVGNVMKNTVNSFTADVNVETEILITGRGIY